MVTIFQMKQDQLVLKNGTEGSLYMYRWKKFYSYKQQIVVNMEASTSCLLGGQQASDERAQGAAEAESQQSQEPGQ